MKKILFISENLPPYLYPQSIQIGRFLQGIKGHFEIYIICAEENSAKDASLYPDLYKDIPSSRILHVSYVHNRFWHEVQNRLLPFFYKRPDLHKDWADRAYAVCLAKYGNVKFDAIITFSFPLSLNLLGSKLKDHYRCRWIAHQSDPWADNPFMNYGPLTRMINQRIERNNFKKADNLIFTNIEAANFYRDKYPQLKDRISYINHSFDPALYPAISVKPVKRKIIRYVGGFYGRRTAEPLLNALKLLTQEARDKLQFEIVGANLKTRIMIKKAGLPRELLCYTGRVNYSESLDLMASSDALLVIDAPVNARNIFFPSKLADYIGAGRPIIGISPIGPTDRILKSLDYPCYRHDQVRELAAWFEAVAGGLVLPSPNVSALDPYQAKLNARKLAEVLNA